MGGRGHNSTRPRRIIPSTFPSNGRMLQYQERGRGHSSTRPRRIIPSTPSSKREKQPCPERGRGHNSTRPRRIIPSTPSSKRKKQRYQEGGREGAQQYQTTKDHTLHLNVHTGECCSIEREGGGTTVPDTVGSYPLQPRQSGRKQQHHVGGRGHNSTRPRRSYPRPSRQTGECCSFKREGGGTAVPDPVGSYPL